MQERPKLVLAVRQGGGHVLSAALSPAFDCIICHTISQAKKCLNGDVAAVLCGVNFDESRMFDLLRHVRSEPSLQRLPFFCLKVGHAVVPPGVFDAIHAAASVMGATAFIQLHDWYSQLGEAEAQARLRAVVETAVAEVRAS